MFSFFQRNIIADEEVDSWFLMQSPWPIFSIITAYLLFVLKIGPSMMKNRQPYKLKGIMLCYNLFQTGYNIYLLSLVSNVVLMIFKCTLQ